jgi:hypothetical protein
MGTFTLRASPDARGTFTLELDVSDGATFLRDSTLAPIPFRLDEPELVTIEIPGVRSRTRRSMGNSR